MSIQLRELSEGIFFETDDFKIRSFPVFHRGADCFGFSFEEESRRPFLPEKAEALGVPNGPQRRDLVNGKSIQLPDGSWISPEDVLGEERPGIRLVHIGDTGRTEDLVEQCRNADALVIEATYLEEELEMARDYSHLTARQAAELAGNAGVKQLFLTHISRRYREKDVLAEAQAVFPDTLVARDFDIFQIKQR
jgi:ribonuclease Z